MTMGVVETRDEWLSTRDGVTPPSSPGGRGGFITDVIVELGLASDAAVQTALQDARFAGQQPGTLLVERGELTANDLARAIAERHGLHHVDLEHFEVDQGAMRLIDRNVATRYSALPIAQSPSGTLIVALADPLDAIAVSDIGEITKSEPLPVIVDADSLRELIDRMPEPARYSAPMQLPDELPGEERAPETAAQPAAQPESVAPPPDPVAFAAPPAPVAPPPVDDGEGERLREEVAGLRDELERERAALTEVETERNAERERAAETIAAVTASAGEADGLRAEIERLRGELAERPAVALDRDDGRAQHAQTAKALEAAVAEKEEMRAELERERSARAERERRQDNERVQFAQATKARDDAEAEVENLRGRLAELEGRREDVDLAGDDIQRALDALNEVTEAARSAATRLGAERPTT